MFLRHTLTKNYNGTYWLLCCAFYAGSNKSTFLGHPVFNSPLLITSEKGQSKAFTYSFDLYSIAYKVSKPVVSFTLGSLKRFVSSGRSRPRIKLTKNFHASARFSKALLSLRLCLSIPATLYEVIIISWLYVISYVSCFKNNYRPI